MKPIDEYYNLRELVADCGGIENFRFFGTLNKYDMMTPFGFALTSPSDDWVECKIEDDTSCGDLYTLAHGYKVRIAPAHDPRYASRLFYQDDLLSMLKRGCFCLKHLITSISKKKKASSICMVTHMYIIIGLRLLITIFHVSKILK